MSIQIRCYKDLVKYGAEQVLQREYGQYVVPAEAGYDFSVMVDLENLPAGKGTREPGGCVSRVVCVVLTSRWQRSATG